MAVKTNPVHVGHWGTFITHQKDSVEAEADAMKVTIVCDGTNPTQALVKTQLILSGKAITEILTRTLELEAGGSIVATTEIAVVKPQLWNIATPENADAIKLLKFTHPCRKGKDGKRGE